MPTLREPIPFYIGDVVRLRKPHPCGSYEWRVVRVGADIGLKCLKCDRRVLLPRRTLEKRLKTFVERGPDYPEPEIESEDAGESPAEERATPAADV